MSMLQKVRKEYIYVDWMKVLQNCTLEKLIWLFSPVYASVSGNKRADSLAGSAAINNNLTIDPPMVLHHVKHQLEDIRNQSSPHTLCRFKEIGV